MNTSEILHELVQTLQAWMRGEGPLRELLFSWWEIASGQVPVD